jgi:hypothetical protein
MKKLILLLLWFAFLGWGARTIHDRPKPDPVKSPRIVGGCRPPMEKTVMPHLVARVNMPVNWRLRPSDLRQPENSAVPPLHDFTGQYLTCEVSKDEPVTADDVTPTNSAISIDPRKSVYRLVLRPGKEDSLNAGQRVIVLSGPTAIVSNGDVKVVICDPRCYAVLQVEPAEFELLKPHDPMELEVLLVK